MNLLKIFLLAAVLSTLLKAQTFEWVNTVPLQIKTDPAYLHSAVTLDNSGNPVISRLVNSKELYSIRYYGDVAVEKRSPSGLLIWGDTIYGKVDISEIITDGEDNLLCTGTFKDTLLLDTMILTGTGSETGSFLLKIDSSGEPVWLKNGKDYNAENGSITALEKDGLNNINIGTNYFDKSKILVLDEDGNPVDSIVQSNIEYIFDIKRDKSDNIWVTGFSFAGSISFNDLDTTAPFPYNQYVVKYNSSGSAKWVSFIRDVTINEYTIVTDDSGNAYLSGTLLDSTSFGNLHANGPVWSQDFFVTKIDPNGNYLWLNEIPPGNGLVNAAAGSDNFLACTGDGRTYFTGYFRNEIDFGNGVVITPIEWYDAFSISYDSNGEVQWAVTAASSLYDKGTGIAADGMGNIYLSGLVSENFVFDTISGTGGFYNLYLAKLTTENAVSVEEGLSDIFVAENFNLLQNYPNPFNPSTTLSFITGRMSLVTLKIYDVLGNEVAVLLNEMKPAGTYNLKFDASNLTSGVYFYQLRAMSSGRQTDDFVQTKKMMLVK